MKKLLALIGVAVLSTLFAGCGSTKPGIVGLRAELVKIDRDGQGGATATWHLVNPNIVSYIVGASKHKIYVNGHFVGTTSTKEAAGIPAQSHVTQAAPLLLDKDGANVLAGAGGSANYRIDSDLTLRLYDQLSEHHSSTATGSVQIVAK